MTAETSRPGAAASGVPPGHRILAGAGIAGPVGFAAGVLVQQFTRRGGYDPIVQPISDLTAGPAGWVQRVNFIGFGVLVVAFAVGLHRGLRPVRAGRAGPILLGLNGAGLVLAGVFPLRADAAGLVYDPLGVHTVNGVIFFLGIGVALVVVSRRLKADPRWRTLATYTLATGVVLAGLFVVLAALARPAGAPLHEWWGLLQRAVLTVWLACVVTLALRLRRLAAGTTRAETAISMSPRLRRFVLTTHVTATVGWLGAVLVFVVLAVIGLTSRDEPTVRGAYLVMEPAARYTLVPLALASVLTGLVQSLGTPWGLFRHYWVLFKLVLAVLATVVLLMYQETFRVMAGMAADPRADVDALRNLSPVLHGVLALLVLLAATVLAVYKPRGMTRYGLRKQAERRRPRQPLSRTGSEPAAAVLSERGR